MRSEDSSISPADMTRFLTKVDLPRRDGGCTERTASATNDGYGKFWLNGSLELAHRVAYRIFAGPIPRGLHILHNCDNPPCVNFRHLHPGDDTMNMEEAYKRHGYRTILSGELNSHAKLTELDVHEIRRLYASGRISQPLIGILFHISRTHVNRIVNFKCWKNIGIEPNLPGVKAVKESSLAARG